VALAMTAFLWLSAQAVQGFIQLVQTGTVTTEPAWVTRGAPVVLGCLLAQLLGNALYEEIAFRGFLLPQVFSKLEKWRDHSGLRLGIALVISQGMFALVHIPIRIYGGSDIVSLAPNLLYLLFLGCFFAVIYLRTGNLFFAVGVHTLLNAPTAVLGSSNSFVILGLGLVLTLMWPVFVPRAAGVRPPVAVPQP
jgi:membrane protease YdiL (CAAX protease family)